MPSWEKCLLPQLALAGIYPRGGGVGEGCLRASITRIESSKILSWSLSLPLLCSLYSLSPLPSPLLLPSGPRAAVASSSLPQRLRPPLPGVPASPASFGNDHLRAHFVEFQPQFSFMEKHLDPFHALEEGEEKSHGREWAWWPFRSPNSPQTQRLLLLPPGACGLRSWKLSPARCRAAWASSHCSHICFIQGRSPNATSTRL